MFHLRSTALRIGTAVLLISALAAASMPHPAQAQGNEPVTTPNTVTVTGIGTATGVPDASNVHLGVEVGGDNAAAAFTEANRLINEVMAAVIAAGVRQQDIQTTGVNIYSQPAPTVDPAAGGGTGSATIARIYQASILLRITVKDAGENGQAVQVGQVISAAVAAGANVINGIELGLSNTKTLEDEARVLAIADARARAEALAATLGATVGNVISVEEYSGGVPVFGGRGGGMAYDAASISQGQFTVGVQVRVTFAIVAAA